MEAIKTMGEISYRRSLEDITTEGLSSRGMQEIRVKLNTPDLFPDGEEFLRFVVKYVTESGRQIRSEETLAYGYWLVKFRVRDEILEVWEYNAEATDFIPGADLALTYWRDQHRVCSRAGAPFTPPRPDRLTVVDEGVLEGRPVQGVRYPSPEHMSGWWITTDRYNGDVNTLRREHTYHITASRPELAKYLALPFGFRFDLTSYEDIWCDEGVASQGKNRSA